MSVPASHRTVTTLTLAAALVLAGAVTATAQGTKPFEPEVGQPGKDVVWVPTPPELVEKMMDLAKVTSSDFVVDLGSGDGRNVIGAAKRGARALGVEFNPDMVALSQRNAAAAGVAGKATFVQGDMYTAEFSDASVLAIFLLPSNMLQLRSKFLDLKPGSRIVSNTFTIQDWPTDEQTSIGGDCSSWCTAVLYIVPAKVEGEWQLPNGRIAFTQNYQMLTGTMTTGAASQPLTGRLRGTDVTVTSNGTTYTGHVDGDTMQLRAGNGTALTATRTRR